MSNSINDKDRLQRPGPLDESAMVWATKVWDKEDSRSLIRLMPEVFLRAALALPEEFKDLDDQTLKQRYKFNPSATDHQLRLSFWLEYDRVQSQLLLRMVTAMIIRGIITEEYLYKHYFAHPARMAFLLIPPKSYTIKMQEMLENGLEQMREIQDLPHTSVNARGEIQINTKVLELKFKIMTYMDMRLNGAIAQKLQIEQKNMNVNFHGTAKELNQVMEKNTMAALDHRLEVLRKREAMLTSGVHPENKPETIEVIQEDNQDLGSKDG